MRNRRKVGPQSRLFILIGDSEDDKLAWANQMTDLLGRSSMKFYDILSNKELVWALDEAHSLVGVINSVFFLVSTFDAVAQKTISTYSGGRLVEYHVFGPSKYELEGVEYH